MNSVLALAIKDLRLLFRDKVGFFFTCFFPLLYCIFFGVIFSQMGKGAEGIPIVIVDEDQTDGSREFVAELEKSAELEVTTADKDAAAKAVQRGNKTAYLVLPKGFGESRKRMFWGEAPELELGIDPARKAESGMLEGILTARLFEGMQKLFSDPAQTRAQVKEWVGEIEKSDGMQPMTRAALLMFLPALDTFMGTMNEETKSGDGSGGGSSFAPAKIKTVEVTRQRFGPSNSYAITFPQGIIWGVMSCAASFGISLVMERTSGTLVRLRTSPIGSTRILLGKAGACGFTTIALASVLFVIAYFAFGVVPGSIPLLVLAIVSMAVCFVGIMMLLSVLGKTEQAAGGIGWGILTMMAMIGGGMVPLMFLPPFLKTVSHVSPVKWSIYAMEGAVWRGLPATEMLQPCGILAGIGVVCFLIGVRAFRWSTE